MHFVLRKIQPSATPMETKIEHWSNIGLKFAILMKFPSNPVEFSSTQMNNSLKTTAFYPSYYYWCEA